MTGRLIAAAVALTFGLSAVAQAQPTETSQGQPNGPAQAQPTDASQTQPTNAPQARVATPPVAQPAGYRSAKYNGGEGSTWKTGKNTHGFAGTYGGCRYTGFAGPNGYRLDKVC